MPSDTYSSTPVPIPSIQGITRFRQDEITYIRFEIGRVYKPEKKYNVPVRRMIGKVCDHDATKMFPNQKYFSLIPGAKPAEEDLPVQTRSCSIKLGAYIVIEKVVQEYQLRKLLEKHFGARAGLVLDLAAYALVYETNVGQYYPSYAFCHPLFTENMRIFSDSTVSKLLGSEITRDQIQGFLDDWNENRDHRHRIYISYDSTNKNCQAGDIELVEYGKAKENKGLPVFNASVAYDKDNKVPLFYEEYLGSLNDMSQFKHFVDKVLEYGYRSVGFILDRGYFSRGNIQYMDDNGFNFVMMIKGCKGLVSDLVLKHSGAFEMDRDCYCKNGIYGTTVCAGLFEGDKTRFIHIYFDAGKMAAERRRLEEDIDHMHEILDTLINEPVEIPDPCRAYFTGHYVEVEVKDEKKGNKGSPQKQRVLSCVLEKKDVIERELKLCGYFCLVTSEKMTAKEALELYKSRDASEKLFQADKSFLGARSMRVHSDRALSSKLFIEFIGLIVRNRIYNLLKDRAGKMKKNKRPNYMTVPAAIDELEQIELSRVGRGAYKLDHALTKHQQIILSSFGISPAEAISKACEVAQQLANAKDPEPRQQDEEEEGDAEEIDIEIDKFED